MAADSFENKKHIDKSVKIDPATSSVIGVTKESDVQQIGTWNLLDHQIVEDRFGRKYYEIIHKGPDQMFLARLIKGILPSSDIVFVEKEESDQKEPFNTKGTFFSYEMPIADMHRPADAPISPRLEAQVYRILLGTIFSDYDKEMEGDTNMHNGKISSTGIALYDFGDFADKFSYSESVDKRDKRLQRDWSEWISYCGSEWQDVRNFLLHKCTELKNRFEGNEGISFMGAIIKNMEQQGIPLPSVLIRAGDDYLHTFQKEILLRIDLLERSLKEK